MVTVAGIHISGTAAAASIPWPRPEQGFTQPHPSLLQRVKRSATRKKLVRLLHHCREPGTSWGPFPGGVIPVPAAVIKSEELHEPHTAVTRSICSGLHLSPPVLTNRWGGFLRRAGVSWKSTGKTGWETTQVEAGPSLLLDGEDLGAKTALGGLEVWILGEVILWPLPLPKPTTPSCLGKKKLFAKVLFCLSIANPP